MTVELSAKPIFILGISPRSGTNFLFNLLRLHPDCEVPDPIWEDYVLEPSHLLVEYAHKVSKWWQADPSWGVDGSMGSLFRQSLGQAVISFLASQAGGKRLLTKTPCVTNLEHFFTLFPDAHLLILVRDGRNIVESGARTAGWDRDVTTRKWAEAARTILSFDRANRERGLRYLIVRYEDLYSDLDNELGRILDFLDLDVSVYDFDVAQQLPVWGSSVFRGGEEQVHWKPVKKTSDFNPTERWKGWSRRLHERFNWLAGQYLIEFGYEKQYPEHSRSWAIYNRVVDVNQRYGLLRVVPRGVKDSLKAMWDRLFG